MTARTLALILAFSLAACRTAPEEEIGLPPLPDAVAHDDEADIDLPHMPEDIAGGQELVIGEWVVMMQDGAHPPERIHVTFTEDGRYVKTATGRQAMESRYNFAGSNILEIHDEGAVRRVQFRVSNTDLVLYVPDTPQQTRLRRAGTMVNR
jgi:hypothetical protein